MAGRECDPADDLVNESCVRSTSAFYRRGFERGQRAERKAITELVEAALHERVLQHEQIEAQILTAAQRDAATTRQAVVLARALSCATASYVEVLAILKSRYKENTDARTSE